MNIIYIILMILICLSSFYLVGCIIYVITRFLGWIAYEVKKYIAYGKGQIRK